MTVWVYKRLLLAQNMRDPVKGVLAVAEHKSAIKRAGQNEKRRLRNRTVKTRLKHVIKEVRQAKIDNPAQAITEPLVKAQSAIDKAAKKGVLHPRTAARKISRLTKLAGASQTQK